MFYHCNADWKNATTIEEKYINDIGIFTWFTIDYG
jgi:hypothetical protein